MRGRFWDVCICGVVTGNRSIGDSTGRVEWLIVSLHEIDKYRKGAHRRRLIR